MQKRITLYLNRRFPDFLSSKEGIIYFILLIPILSYSIILFQPRGLYNWHEFHKNLVVIGFCFTFLSTYALVYAIKAFISPNYFNAHTWSVGKQLRFLLTHFFPAVVFTTLLFVHTFIEEFGLSIQSFSLLQQSNIIISIYTALTFGYFVSVKLKKVEELVEINETGEVEKAEEMPEIKDIAQQEAAEEDIVNDTGLVIIPVPNEVEATAELPSEIIVNGIPLVVKDICYVESKGKGISIRILRNGELIEFSTRYTLTMLENDLKGYSYIFRCQKSFIVNILHIKHWYIADHKTFIHIKYCSCEISIKRDKLEEIKELLRKNYIFKANKKE